MSDLMECKASERTISQCLIGSSLVFKANSTVYKQYHYIIWFVNYLGGCMEFGIPNNENNCDKQVVTVFVFVVGHW